MKYSVIILVLILLGSPLLYGANQCWLKKKYERGLSQIQIGDSIQKVVSLMGEPDETRWCYPLPASDDTPERKRFHEQCVDQVIGFSNWVDMQACGARAYQRLHRTRLSAALLKGDAKLEGNRLPLKRISVGPFEIMTRRLKFLTVLLFVLLCIQGCERKLTVLESDKTIFLRAQDLVGYGYRFQAIEKYESFSKAKGIDGSYDVEYEFKTPEAEREDPLLLYVLVSVGKKSVQMSQGSEKIALLYTLKAKGIEEEEIPNFYRYGDSSSFYLLKKKGKPIGNYFRVREGNKTYTILLSGVYFDDPQLWKELIEPKLKQFSVYEPA